MSSSLDLNNQIAQLRREIEGIRVAMNPRAKAADASPSKLVTVVAAGAFALGDVVYNDAGTWSYVTTATTGQLIVGVVVGTSAGTVTIALAGPRSATGTPGDVYWVQDAGGGAGASPTASGKWWRKVEMQIDPNTRMVCPDVIGFQPWNVQTCDNGGQVNHVMGLNDQTGVGP